MNYNAPLSWTISPVTQLHAARVTSEVTLAPEVTTSRRTYTDRYCSHHQDCRRPQAQYATALYNIMHILSIGSAYKCLLLL